MGVKITINGYQFNGATYSVQEDATPLAAGDSTGGVGTFDITVPRPDPDAHLSQGKRLLADYGPDFFLETEAYISDSSRGAVVGTVRSVSRNDEDGSLTFTCVTRLDLLNIYNVQAKPYIGTLGGAIDYYFSLADVTSGFVVDPEVASRSVTYPGWSGELWYHLKLVCAAQDCEITLINGTITFRAVRGVQVVRGRDLTRNAERRIDTIAQAVEVYNYNNRRITNELVYPTRGWDGSLEVLNVNAGEVAEYQLELSASVSSIQTPTMVENVGPDYKASSVYTIVANDGLPIPPALWSRHGGKVQITINPDTTSLTVKLFGAVGIPTVEGEFATNFSLALASDTTSNRYSTLRIVGSGVAFDKQVTRIRTGVPPEKTATEVGVTIDNPFLSGVDETYRAGTRAAKQFSGANPTLSGSVIALTRNGDDPVIGNVQGARVYDRRSHRWFRVRTGTTTRESIDFQADDDFTIGDMMDAWGGRTYAQIASEFPNFTYRQLDAAGWKSA